jgi:hypothetical protein
MTEEKSSTAGAAAGGTGTLWAGGAAVGLAVGAAVWFFALGRMPHPVMAPAVEESAAVKPDGPAEVVVSGPAAETAEHAAPTAKEPDVTAAAEPVATDPAVSGVAEPADIIAAAPAAAAVVPAFDTVRAEADGSVLVAGRAAPGQDVVVMADGAEVGRATADVSGNFVAFLSMGPSAAARVLSLKGTGADGTVLASAASVILAPVAAPAKDVVASAEPIAAAEPAADVPAGPSAEATTTADTATEVATAEPAPVAAVTPPEPLIADAAGVRKLAPAAVSGVVVDTITYGALGQVQIAGRGAAGSFARLYLDNTGIVTAPVGSDGGWGAVLTDVAPGIYTLRVDQLDASGSVTSRFETPFQREAPEIVTAAAEPAVAVPAAESTATPAVTAKAATPAAADAAPAAVTRAAIVTVQPGFTLWQIARENYGDGALYVKVFEANKAQIRDPDLIYPGQIFAVPEGGN